MKSILFLGNANQQDYQSLKELGYQIFVICDPGTIYKCDSTENFDRYWEANLRQDKEHAFNIISELLDEFGDDLIVLNVGETFVQFASEVSERFNLPGLSSASAVLSLEKTAMKNRFIEKIGPHSTAAFLQLDLSETNGLDGAAEKILRFAKEHQFPLVVKPTNLYGSFYTTISKNELELIKNLTLTVEGIRSHIAAGKASASAVIIQVEEFLEGSVHSIDCVVQDGTIKSTPVIDVQTGNDLGYDDFFHFARMAPSWLTREQQAKMKAFALSGVEALGIRWGVAHVEVIQTKKGPRLL